MEIVMETEGTVMSGSTGEPFNDLGDFDADWI